MKNSRASVSLAHGEPFGLTPIEAFVIGTPAVYVNEGGFTETIIDKENGRLIERDDLHSWHLALEEAEDMDIRTKWSEKGLERIEKLNLSCEMHAERIFKIYQQLING